MTTALNTEPALTAIRKCIEGTLGAVRTVTAGDLTSGLQDAASDEKLHGRARIATRYDVKYDYHSVTDAILSDVSDVKIIEVGFLIQLFFTTEHELDEDQRVATRAGALDLMEQVRAALSWSGNLLNDGESPAVATNLVSAKLSTEKGSRARVVREDWDKRIYVVELPMYGYLKATHPVT